jgi:(p)ppGpp synthase/HD superfamily hydrolase
MNYHLRIYDNYHHGNESEAYDHGSYATYEEAERAAKAIVVQFLENKWERGVTAGILTSKYALHGVDVVILPAEGRSGKPFSVKDYVNEMAESICLELENEQKRTEVQTLYQEAIKFATSKHQEKDQKVKGTNLPYVVHLSNVAMEILVAASRTEDFDLVYATQVALLHDTIEDTETTFDEVRDTFGEDIAVAVLALSKDDTIPAENQIKDSIARIKKLRKEVWAVKLADRITNLQPPPSQWTGDKNSLYAEEAQLILDELRDGNAYLAKRLEAKIAEYKNLIKGL